MSGIYDEMLDWSREDEYGKIVNFIMDKRLRTLRHARDNFMAMSDQQLNRAWATDEILSELLNELEASRQHPAKDGLK